jgi:transposase
MKEQITLSQKEQARAGVLNLLLAGRCTTERAAELLGLSARQVRRLKRRYRDEGVGALLHGNQGRTPGNALAPSVRAQITELATSVYAGYNHSHLWEILSEEHGLAVSRATVSRVLRAAGLRSPRRRKATRYRARRAPVAGEGMLVQVDASHHDWLEGRGPRMVLVGGVDDATGAIVSAHFRDREDAAGYLHLLREMVHTHGIPLAWYSDKHGAFRRNDKEPWTVAEQLAGRREPTQVARALEQLGVTLITAHTPQAKGRVERCWGTLQDRLVKELRRAGAKTIEDANAVLAVYLPRYRARFARPAADRQLAYRRLPKRLDLDGVCSFHYRRVVSSDNVIRLEERVLQLPPGKSYARRTLDVHEHLDGRLVVIADGRVVAQQATEGAHVAPRRRQRGWELPHDPKPPRPALAPIADVDLPGDLLIPPPTTHPWRRTRSATR